MFSINRKVFIDKLIGERSAYTLEARIYHSICVLTLIALFINIFANYFMGLPKLSILMVVGIAVMGFCYYFSRALNRFVESIVVYNILSNILLIANYFFNSGIDGPTLLIFMLSCFINISVAPPAQNKYWFVLNILIVGALLSIEYYYPEYISNTYPDTSSRFIDNAYSYIVLAVMIAFITNYIRKRYNSEKSLVERKAKELEAANATKNKLFSILAHDLRAPLSSIQNYLEILSEFRLTEEERHTINKDLLNSTQNTQQMLSNLLLWTKSQMEGVTVNLAAINLNETLHNTLQIQKNAAEEKGILLRDRINSNMPVIADADMLQLIVRNLINNAIKFSNPGGEIMVSSEISSDRKECRICVTDTGIGIPLNMQAEVFSLKASSTYGTKKEKGVGLGLLLCKEFTQMQNGRIWFTSVPGEGTTFYISLKLFKSGIAKKNMLPAML